METAVYLGTLTLFQPLVKILPIHMMDLDPTTTAEILMERMLPGASSERRTTRWTGSSAMSGNAQDQTMSLLLSLSSTRPLSPLPPVLPPVERLPSVGSLSLAVPLPGSLGARRLCRRPTRGRHRCRSDPRDPADPTAMTAEASSFSPVGFSRLHTALTT